MRGALDTRSQGLHANRTMHFVSVAMTEDESKTYHWCFAGCGISGGQAPDWPSEVDDSSESEGRRTSSSSQPSTSSSTSPWPTSQKHGNETQLDPVKNKENQAATRETVIQHAQKTISPILPTSFRLCSILVPTLVSLINPPSFPPSLLKQTSVYTFMQS